MSEMLQVAMELDQIRQGIWPTNWARRVQKLAQNMSPEELAEFPDIIRAEEAHRLIFTATYELFKGDESLASIISACGRRLRGRRLGLATGFDMYQSGRPTAFYNAVTKSIGGESSTCDFNDESIPLETKLALLLWTEWMHTTIMTEQDLQKAKAAHIEL